jgi:BatD DUF11 like domain
MRPAKYMVLYILCCNFFPEAHAQNKNKIPAGVSNIFDALPIDDPAKNSVLQPGEDSLEKIKNNLFVTGVISKNHCYLGEPILLTYTLYSALQSNSKVERPPSFAGFSVDAMETDNEQVIRKKQYGKNYRVFTVQKVELTPLQEGVLTIEPISIYNEVSYKENEKEFHYGGRVEGKAITINVGPLPVAGRPASFTGATGNFILQAHADTVSVAGENNTLHIEVAGTGNFNAISLPEIIWPAGCEHFSVTNHQQIIKNSFPPSGKKTFEIPFVAAKEGTLVIPAMQIPFFDTQKKMYRVAATGPITILVGPALYKPGPGNAEPPVKRQLPVYYYLLPAVIVLALIAIVFYKKKKRIATRMAKPITPLPEIASPAEAPENKFDKEQLESLNVFNDTTEYITAFKKMFTDLLRRQTGISSGSEEALLQQIETKDTELATAAGNLYAQCNNLLYAPGDLDTVTRKEMEDTFISIADKMSQTFG